MIGDIPYLVAHLKDDHKVDMHNGSTFNHRYVKSNPHEVENATWMLTVHTFIMIYPGPYSFMHILPVSGGEVVLLIILFALLSEERRA